MIFALCVLMTVSALVMVSACYAARNEPPTPRPLEQRRNKKKVREALLV